MTKKELKKLSRAELLELLLIQTQEVERLRGELEETKQLLEDKRIRVEKAGSLADAVLQVNEVMYAAQKAADQYLENIIAMEEETKQKCIRLLQVAEEEKERILLEAYVSRNVSGSDVKKKSLEDLTENVEENPKEILEENPNQNPEQDHKQNSQNDSDKEVNKE